MSFPVVWNFFQDNTGLWHWRHYSNDNTFQESDKAFAVKSECVNDAKKHGYQFKIDDFDLYQGNHD